MKNQYEDIIHMPHHVSTNRPRMSLRDRAAQFSPFAALTGYDAAVKETARLTDERIEIDENEKSVLNGKLQMIAEAEGQFQEVTVTYFVPDEKKKGGAYVDVTGCVKKIDTYARTVVMCEGTVIPIKEIIDISVACDRQED